jgi:beta-galactosidase
MLKKIGPLCGSDYQAPLAIVKDFDNMADAEVDVWHGRLDFPDEENIYRQAQLSHVPCDFVYLSDAADASDLDRYQVLIYPHPAIMTEGRAKILKEYVEKGGTLILGCRSGYKDINGQCIMSPAPGLLSDLTGTTVKESGFQHPAEPDAFVILDGEALNASVFQDHLDPGEGTEVLARYQGSWFTGTAALTEHRTGEGSCIHWGSTFSLPVLKKLFAMTGLSGRFDDRIVLPECIEIAERTKDGRRFLILLNYMPGPQEIVLLREMKNLVTEETVKGRLTVGGFGVLVLEEAE